ncbi:HNH endonuclease (plasmid) [Streptomyces chartreusis]|uniref:HNH endonuclease n=1 Tax=Streptomyces chartreusis TaxID=1969 RepID=UPI0037DC0AB9|nr:HNH endonuclease [Streptomyces chartreusis]
MALLDLDGTGQPMDPKLILAIESAFNSFSLTDVTFVPAPQVWRKSNRKGSASGPKTARKAEIKLELAKRDGFRCAYCAREFVDLDEATLDHVIPNSIVGHWQTWNLLLACDPCNNLKADRVPLVLMPMLCTLLTALLPTVPALRKLNQSIADKNRVENARRNRARKLRKEQHKAVERRLRIVRHLEALTDAPVLLAIEAPAPRAALLPGGAQ